MLHEIHTHEPSCEYCDYRERDHATTAAMILCGLSGFALGLLVWWAFS